MYVNGKMRPVETVQGGEIREDDGGMNSTMICCKSICKCHSVPPAQQ
jgi:hypothetical protein